MAIQIKTDQVVNAIVSTSKLGNNAVTPAKADLSAVWAFTAAPSYNADPSGANDLCRKSYVDSLIKGLHWKDSCRVRSSSDVTIAGPGSTISGITMAAGDRVLLTAQTTASENGLWDYNGAASAMTRSDDADTFQELNGAAVFIREGASADEGYTQTAELSGFAGQSWALFTATAGGRVAGAGLSLSSNTLSVNVDNAAIQINGSDALTIKASGVGTNEIGNSVVTNAKLQNSSITVGSGNGITGGGSVALGGSTSLAVQLNGSTLSVSGAGLSINTGGVQSANLAASCVNSAAIADGAVTLDKLSNLSSAQMLVGNATNRPAGVSISGDISINNAGVTTIQAASVQTGMIADAACTNAKLASSALTITASNGLQGGGSISLGSSGSLSVKTDGSSLSVSAAGCKIADNGVGSAQIAASAIQASHLSAGCVATAKLADDCVTDVKVANDSMGLVKMSFRPESMSFSGNSATKYDLSQTVLAAFHKGVKVYRNGLRCKFVASAAAAADNSEYSVANDGTGGVTAITFGAAPNGDLIICDFIY